MNELGILIVVLLTMIWKLMIVMQMMISIVGPSTSHCVQQIRLCSRGKSLIRRTVEAHVIYCPYTFANKRDRACDFVIYNVV